MIPLKLVEDQIRQGRFDAKTLDSLLRRRIEEGANCSPFVSQAILDTVKEVFFLGLDDPDHQLGLGLGSTAEVWQARLEKLREGHFLGR